MTDEKFSDVKDALKKAYSAGVKKIIIPSTSLEDARRAVVIATQENQYCLAGIHPEEVEKMFNDIPDGFRVKPGMTLMGGGSSTPATADRYLGMTESEKLDIVMEELKKIIESSERVVGVGEIGLDYYWDKEKKTKKMQTELFLKQMQLAADSKLPAAIHMRGSEEEMKIELLSMKSLPTGQFHCFGGSSEFLELVLSKGFYVSFCGNITYKSAGDLRYLLKQVPLKRLLLETDSPYLSPEPLRGTVNGPANVKITAEFIASELNIDYRKLTEITSQNTKCLYSLDI